MTLETNSLAEEAATNPPSLGRRIWFGLDLGVNLGLPWLAYKIAEPHLGEVGALLVSALPPLIWAIVELLRRRRFDLISGLSMGGIGLSLLGVALGGDARLILLRESLISGLIGAVFLASLLLPKPLLYYLARATLARQDSESSGELEEIWNEPGTRGYMRLITLVWGLGLSAEAALRAWFAWHWSSERFLAITPFISYGLYGLLFAWTLWYRKCHVASSVAES